MAISVSNLTTFFSATNDGTSPSSYVSASVTLHAGNLGLLAVYSHRTGGASSPTSISGPGSTTWVEVAHEDSFTIASPLCRLTLYRACNATDQTGTITVTFGATQSNCFMHCNEVSGSAATSGNNGSDGIQQNVLNHSDSQASPFSVTLAALQSANNAAFAVFAAKSQTQNYTAGSGFTGLGNINGTGTASDSGDVFAEWEINATACSVTYTTAQTNSAVAIEIIAASAFIGDDDAPVTQPFADIITDVLVSHS